MAFWDNYEIIEEKKHGGEAKVIKVRQKETGDICAIRVLESVGEENYKRIHGEIDRLRVLDSSSHKNIVHYYDAVFEDNSVYIVMDYVDGRTLDEYLTDEQGFVETEEVIRMAIQISSALALCHMKNIIHNDLHTKNIIRRKDGIYVLLDFGLSFNENEDLSLCRHYNGRAEFRSPEKYDVRAKLTKQTDIYAFGVVMFKLLAGRVPFQLKNKNWEKLEEAILNDNPPSILELREKCFEEKYQRLYETKDYPQWVEVMILKCLEKNPKKRFKDGGELYQYIINQLEESSESDEVSMRELRMVQLEKEMADLADKNTELDKIIRVLRDKNNELDKKIGTLRNKNNELDRIIQSQKRKISRKKMYIRFWISVLFLLVCVGTIVGAYFYSQDFQFPVSNSRSAGYAPRINNQELEEAKVIIEHKNKQIETKDAEIAELKNAIDNGTDNQDEIRQLKQTVADKERQVSEKDKQIAENTKEILRKEKEIVENEKEIAELKKRIGNITNNTTEIKRLNKSIDEKNGQISELQRDIANKKERVKELETKLAHNQRSTSQNISSADVTYLKSELSQKQTEVSGLNNRINNLKRQLDDANREIEILKKHINPSKK